MCDTGSGEYELVGRSPVMIQLRTQIKSVAKAETTVLISGETGSGKGLVARAIHELSSRRNNGFHAVDLASIANSVFESELFGHEKGAFTGAFSRRIGQLEAAGDGTLFLDEIGEVPLELQPRLLRVLNDRVFTRIGGNKKIPLRARVLAATNVDLNLRIRPDLLYRLNTFVIQTPALRDHPEDIPQIVESSLSRIARRVGRQVPVLTDSAYESLIEMTFTGNVRELENQIERLLLLDSRDRIDDAVLSGWSAEPSRPVDPGVRLPGGDLDDESLERVRLESEIAATGGNVSRMARRLGLPRSTLRYKIMIHGLGSLIPKD